MDEKEDEGYSIWNLNSEISFLPTAVPPLGAAGINIPLRPFWIYDNWLAPQIWFIQLSIHNPSLLSFAHFSVLFTITSTIWSLPLKNFLPHPQPIRFTIAELPYKWNAIPLLMKQTKKYVSLFNIPENNKYKIIILITITIIILQTIIIDNISSYKVAEMWH